VCSASSWLNSRCAVFCALWPGSPIQRSPAQRPQSGPLHMGSNTVVKDNTCHYSFMPDTKAYAYEKGRDQSCKIAKHTHLFGTIPLSVHVQARRRLAILCITVYAHGWLQNLGLIYLTSWKNRWGAGACCSSSSLACIS
jgi:hypothetical protein